VAVRLRSSTRPRRPDQRPQPDLADDCPEAAATRAKRATGKQQQSVRLVHRHGGQFEFRRVQQLLRRLQQLQFRRIESANAPSLVAASTAVTPNQNAELRSENEELKYWAGVIFVLCEISLSNFHAPYTVKEKRPHPFPVKPVEDEAARISYRQLIAR